MIPPVLTSHGYQQMEKPQWMSFSYPRWNGHKEWRNDADFPPIRTNGVCHHWFVRTDCSHWQLQPAYQNHTLLLFQSDLESTYGEEHRKAYWDNLALPLGVLFGIWTCLSCDNGPLILKKFFTALCFSFSQGTSPQPPAAHKRIYWLQVQFEISRTIALFYTIVQNVLS